MEVTMEKLLDTKQEPQEPVKDYIERFRYLSLLCPAGMPITMLLQTRRHNFLGKVEERMGAVKAHTWKELVEQAEIAEKSANKHDLSASKPKWQPNNGNRDSARTAQSKGKGTLMVETLTVDAPDEGQAAPKKPNPGGTRVQTAPTAILIQG